jgi:hypothetical protein
MRVNNKIKSLIDELTATHLTPGVQPSEIADAIFEDNYKSIESENKNGIISMSVTFMDCDDEGSTSIIVRYTYNPDRVLMRVEQKVGKRPFKIQWDREQAIESLLTQISNHLAKLNSDVNVQQVMDTVPSELRLVIKKRLTLVA